MGSVTLGAPGRSKRSVRWPCRPALRGLLAAALAAWLVGEAVAQVIPPGEQAGRERERFIEPQAPRAQPAGAPIALPSTTAPPEAATVQLVIRRVRIVGATVYSDADLAPLYQDLLGTRVPLQAVYDLAQRITAKYGADGYVLSRAIVPEQELSPSGATVRIEVIEGYIDEVEWPARLTHYRDFFTAYALKITAERPINIRTLERYLLLANDLPGLKFKTALRPSKTRRGAATLVVEVDEKSVDVYARVDNRGTRARGPLQLLISPTLNNLLRQHESVMISYGAAVPFKELQFVALNYRQVLSSEGLTAVVNGNYSWGHPGTGDLEALDFRTRSLYAEAGMQFPVIRARERNLTLAGLVFAGENYSFWNLTPTDPQAVDRLRGLRLRAEGDFADKAGGINQFSVTVSQGIDGAGSTDNGNLLASRGGGRVDFTKVEGMFSRLQPLPARFSALVAVYGQYAFTPLLVPEQCGYGGRVFGRAFDPSELLGDHCVMASAELRFDLPPPGGPAPAGVSPAATHLPNVQFYGFSDIGKLYRVAVGAVGTAAATFTGASAGGGVRLGWQNAFNVDLSAAKAIEGPRDDWRFFFVTSVRY
jgi:hemolysin activation/secretion protein